MSTSRSDESSEAEPTPRPIRTWRTIPYAIVLAALAGLCCMHRISEGTLFGDEATFASTTDRMRETGDWVVPYIAGSPHLNATPLYNWLCLAILPEAGGTPWDYRFWSAAFGVGCVLLAFVLGTRLFSPEVGFLAGLLLVFNRDFLFNHGVRFGGMEAMLTFFLTGAVLFHVRIREGNGRVWPLWALLGLCIGLAWLSKPPAFGICFFGLIVLHHLWQNRRAGIAAWVGGPLLALAVGTATAAPWYVMLCDRLGSGCLHSLFIYNSVERALDSTGHNFFSCVEAINHSSGGFKFVCPALVLAVACWVVGYRRMAWEPLLVVAGGFLLALTVARKGDNYIYYAFPMLAVLVAAAFVDAAPRLAGRWVPHRAAVAIGVIVAIIVVAYDANKVLHKLFGPVWIHPSVGLHERLTPEIERGQCRFVLVGFPVSGSEAPMCSGGPEDLYYSTKMPLAERVGSPEELRPLVATGKPIVAILPVYRATTLPADLVPIWAGKNPAPVYAYPVFVFNGIPGNLTPAELTRLASANMPGR